MRISKLNDVILLQLKLQGETFHGRIKNIWKAVVPVCGRIHLFMSVDNSCRSDFDLCVSDLFPFL